MAQSQLAAALGTQESVISNVFEAARHHMQQDAAHQLYRPKTHSYLVINPVIFPFEINSIVLDPEQAVVTTRPALGVAAHVLKNPFRTFDWRPDMDVPVFPFAAFK
jgi:hypothetical protein